MLISCVVTAQLICVFVFAYANRWFSHGKAHLSLGCVDFNFAWHASLGLLTLDITHATYQGAQNFEIKFIPVFE